ncbi:MAG: hypothetical protein AVDCRST_MAG02-534 [uncultured Rubrobacteraceae bacterium]|uniref:Uncharacterized protein n=1 Tax=uncultured Rubrobacteraceae bacterium TaxID=349277 RepID=A0A6J4QV82_9ACTN|nr:MAG: hypothetical protein AVDCRST_MAG02-534 [uncultured Rubrobacteraceae bacterium]
MLSAWPGLASDAFCCGTVPGCGFFSGPVTPGAALAESHRRGVFKAEAKRRRVGPFLVVVFGVWY